MRQTFKIEPRGHPFGDAWLNCFKTGLKCHDAELRAGDADVLVLWSGRQTAAIERQLARGGQHIILECGYVGDRHGWCSAGVGGLNGRAKFPKIMDAGERWRRHFGHLGPEPWRSGLDAIIILGQCPGDMALRACRDYPAWLETAARELRKANPIHLIRFRPHPQAPNLGIAGVPSTDGALGEAVADADFVVTWNSNAAVECVLKGIPAITMDIGSMAWPVAAHDLGAVVSYPDRENWCHDLAWAQWSPGQMAGGETIEALKGVLD